MAKDPQFNLRFSAIDHSVDYVTLANSERLRKIYSSLPKEGIEAIHYDWHWKKIEPEPGEFDHDRLNRYAAAKGVMEKSGLNPPTIIFSNPPRWAIEFYKKDRIKFFEAYERYIEEVKKYLEADPGYKIGKIQILNELNNFVYNPINAEDLPRLCRITRKIFFDYNPDIKIVASLLVGNLTSIFRLGVWIDDYLKEFEKIRDNFDVVSLNYFPGLWHWPIREAGWQRSNWFGQLDKLQEVFETISNWEVEYEIGEVGFPTNGFWGNEKKQVEFFESFFKALRKILEELKKRGDRLPAEVCFFELTDEEPEDWFGKIIGKTFSPEYDFGLFKSNGEKKMILQKIADPPGAQCLSESRLANMLKRMEAE